MFLIAAFIFSLNPLYVVLLTLFWGFSSLTSKSPKLHLPNRFRSKSLKETLAYSPEDIKSTLNDGQFDPVFDHVLVGNDLGTLYTAALLARNNHKCCVLQPVDGIVTKVRELFAF